MAEKKSKVRNIGIPNVEPPERICDDAHCPFHGNLTVRGHVMEGIVVSTMMHKTIVLCIFVLVTIPSITRPLTDRLPWNGQFISSQVFSGGSMFGMPMFLILVFVSAMITSSY